MSENKTEVVTVYADGACKGNPGPGGWGVLIRMGHHSKELFGGEAMTTNNRMELTAAIRGLEALKRPCRVHVYTDSEYVQRGVSEWFPDWKRRGWRTVPRLGYDCVDCGGVSTHWAPAKGEGLWRCGLMDRWRS